MNNKKLDEKVFLEGISLIAELYDKKPSKSLLNLYYTTLQELSDEDFKSAINTIARTNKYNCMPKPAEILENVNGTQKEESLKAWCYVLSAIGNVGAYRSPTFEDGAIARVINHLGGWVYLCDKTSEELKWIEKDFEKFYPVFKKQGAGSMVKLLGITEQYNAQNNLECFDKEKIYIGSMSNSLRKIEIDSEEIHMQEKLKKIVQGDLEDWQII
jgi:hypothetical protein